MAWLWISLLFLGVLAPVFLLLPSPRERQQARLRLHARSLGLEVKLAHLKKIKASAEDYADASGRPQNPVIKCLRYGLIFDSNKCSVFFGQSWCLYYLSGLSGGTSGLLPFDGLASWYYHEEAPKLAPQEADREALARALSVLPKGVLGFECQPPRLAVFWLEEGEQAEVEAIYHALKLLAG